MIIGNYELRITNYKSMSTTKPVERLYTFAEYLTYNDGTDKRYELEDGVLLETRRVGRLRGLRKN
ncbi:hypothetical protein [Nostoc sp.]